MYAEINEFALFTVFIAAFVIAIETGYRLGRRQKNSDESVISHLGALQAAILGLLALLLGFTFSMAMSRYDARKSLVSEEANAIGTAQLRSTLLPPALGEEAGELLGQYVAARLMFYEAGDDAAKLAASYVSTTRLQSQLWSLVARIAGEDSRSIPVGLFIQTLNEAFDLSEKRRAALEDHVHPVVLHLLLGVSIFAFAFMAYAGALVRPRRDGSTLIFAILVALVITAILDIDRPRSGLITVGQDSMLRLKMDVDAAKK